LIALPKGNLCGVGGIAVVRIRALASRHVC